MRYNSKNKSEAEAGLLSDKWLGGKVVAAVKAIPSRKKEPSLKKVAACCRVSTKAQDQLDSLAVQEQYYEERIKANRS